MGKALSHLSSLNIRPSQHLHDPRLTGLNGGPPAPAESSQPVPKSRTQRSPRGTSKRTMNNTRDPSRLRMGLNPLVTSPLGPGYQQNHPQNHPPLSAVALSPNTQYSIHSPASAIQPYNPQQWIASPIAGPERTHGYGREQPSKPLRCPPLIKINVHSPLRVAVADIPRSSIPSTAAAL